MHKNEYGHVSFDSIYVSPEDILKFESLPLIDLTQRNEVFAKKSKEYDIFNCLNLLQILSSTLDQTELMNIDQSLKNLFELNLQDYDKFCLDSVLVLFCVFIIKGDLFVKENEWFKEYSKENMKEKKLERKEKPFQISEVKIRGQVLLKKKKK